MNTQWMGLMVGLALVAGTGLGADGEQPGSAPERAVQEEGVVFTAPTEEQLTAAAENPDLVADLLAGASVEQATEVVRLIIAKIANLSLPSGEQSARITALIGQAFATLPGQAVPLAEALGTALSGGSFPAEVVSTVQQAVITAGGSEGSEAGLAFGTAYTVALTPDVGSITGTDLKTNPEAPPLGQFYEGQLLP